MSSAIDILRDLVAFPTVSRDSNLELIAYVEKLLATHGVLFTRVTNAQGTKANLLARVGPEAEGGIILSGHTDVVPIDGQKWDTPPFTLTVKGPKIYGRGTCDMKGFLACVLSLLPEMTKAKLKKPLYLAFTYDEEVGCLGAPELLAHMVKVVKNPLLCIIGEPTNMRVVSAHQGVYSYETIVTGKEAHSSQPHRGVNAVHIGSKLVNFLIGIAEENSKSGMKNERFEPPWSTVHVGILEGGTARNIIARQCRIVWEVRPLPGDRAESVAERLKEYCKKFPEAGITTTLKSHMTGLQLDLADETEKMVMAAARTNATHAVSFGTEAGVYQDHGVPVVVCGPGSIDQAHQPNEFIEAAELEKGVEFLKRIIMMQQ